MFAIYRAKIYCFGFVHFVRNNETLLTEFGLLIGLWFDAVLSSDSVALGSGNLKLASCTR